MIKRFETTGFERRADSNFSDVEKNKFQKILESQKEKQDMNLEHFVGIYSEDEIEKDRKMIKQKEIEFGKKSPEGKEIDFYSSVLETIIAELADSWLPGFFYQSFRFDDIFHNTDSFYEFESNDSKFEITLDVTSSKEAAANKLRVLFRKVANRERHDVKYFYSELEGKPIGNKDIPLFIIGAPREEIIEIGKIYLKIREEKDSVIRSRHLNNLRNHRLGRELYEELILQLEDRIVILKDIKDTRRLAETEEILNFLKDTLAKKEDLDTNQGPNSILEAIQDAS